MEPKATNIVFHAPTITAAMREKRAGHKGAILWFTGLSGSGKSTLAHEVEAKLFERGAATYVLDGDNVRHGLNGDLGFSPEDRVENIRRVGEVAKLMMDAGLLVLVCFISPYREDRDSVRAKVEAGRFVEVYVNAPLAVCESRDPKGLYKKARAGEIPEFTGISAPYETPAHPEIDVETDKADLQGCADQVVAYLKAKGLLG